MKAIEALEKGSNTSNNDIDGYNSFIIYGAGNVGKEVFTLLKKKEKKILSFIDANADDNASYEGVRIYNPDNDFIDDKSKQECLVIVSIFNRDVSLTSILELLKKKGFKNCITYVQFHKFFADELKSRFWLGNTNKYKIHQAEIQELYNYWADDQSRDIYEGLLNFRFTGEEKFLPANEGQKNQYFPKSLPAMREPLRFIDGGAYDGDSLMAILNSGIACQAIASFEPDLKNFNKLFDFCSKHKTDLATDAVYLFPCALWSKTEYLMFQADNGEASNVTINGSASVLAISLDQTIPSFGPNFIKMDIEGAELEALHGASAIIKEFRPRLGICLYHKPEHLWEIPLLIRSWNLNYKFHLRLHGENGLELVLYAIPA